MKKFLNEFKAFALRGNVMDMAVGVIIGAAFQAIVTSLTNDVISPFIDCSARLTSAAWYSQSVVLTSDMVLS